MIKQSDIIDKFVEYRKKINAWFEQEPKNLEMKGVTWLHFEEGFKKGYEQRLKDEHEEMMDAL